MTLLPKLLDNNRALTTKIRSADPASLEQRIQTQAPVCLWVVCSDSCIPADPLVGLASRPPGRRPWLDLRPMRKMIAGPGIDRSRLLGQSRNTAGEFANVAQLKYYRSLPNTP
jgi:hypothetical protein